MSRKSIYLAILLAVGCGTKNYNVANPVVGPAPPRIKDALARQDQKDGADAVAESGLKSVSAEGVKTVNYESETPLAMTDVVAKVNGRPVLAGEILEQYNSKLKEYQAQLALGVSKGALDEATRQRKIRETQEMLIKRDMDRFVEQILMADAVRSKLKKEQLDSINEQLAGYFEKDVVANLKQKFEVETTLELEGVLQAQGMSLETMRRMFTDQQLASQYIRTKMGEDPKPSRAELLAVYNAQIEKYSRPMQVKWQQLQVNTGGPQNQSKARARIEEAQAALKDGMSFDDVVKKYSDGPLKDNGGHWDWTQPESVANPEIRKVLQKMKTGEISPVLVTNASLQIIKVTGRREAGNQPLEEVQEDLRQQIISEFREKRASEVVAEIRAKAVVETMFDDEVESPEKTQLR
ncbi:peptidylprolyl isomerase [Planctomicrobium sp. SH661]|uniref:peptidylprolyl isomerase n=1 Tax=Planctomicrobium sp. SH661 TaxID=3448124 RepID=UPI003F5B21A0